jgi:protein O-GlcNAc transferase
VQNDHAAGLLVHGLVPLLVAANFEVIIFHIDAVSNRTHISWDAVKSTLQERAHLIGYLPLNLGDCASVIRAAQLDVLVYPDIGMDPMSYFLTYSRLAPVQAAWLAHPDTSGVATVDYFLGSDIEMSEAQSRYSETLHRMRNLGTVFVDTYQVYAAKDHSSPRTNLLERARFIEEIGLPRSAHLYVIAQPLDRLHPAFDAALIKILTQDRLGYLLFVDPSAATRLWKMDHSWLRGLRSLD